MIEREFLFWVIVGTSLISYSIGYFLWLFVYWYVPDKELKTRTFKVYKDDGELRLGLNTLRNLALEELSSKSPWPGNVLVSNYSWDRRTNGIEVTVTFVSYEDPKVMPQLNTKVVTPDPNLPSAKTSGEPEKEKPTSPPTPPIENTRPLGTCPKCGRKAVLISMSQNCCYHCY